MLSIFILNKNAASSAGGEIPPTFVLLAGLTFDAALLHSDVSSHVQGGNLQQEFDNNTDAWHRRSFKGERNKAAEALQV